MFVDWKDKNKKYFRKDLFELCQSESNLVTFKNLALSLKDKFDDESLSFAFIGSSSIKMINLVENLAEEIGIPLEPYVRQACNQNPHLLEYYDSKWNIIEKELSEEYFIQDIENGIVCDWASFDVDSKRMTEAYIEYLNKNIFTKIAEKTKNRQVIEYMLNQKTPTPKLVQYTFIQACLDSNIVTLSVLMSNDNTREMIESSQDIQAYLNEPTQHREIKLIVAGLLNNIKLKNNLDSSLEVKTSGNKHKI